MVCRSLCGVSVFTANHLCAWNLRAPPVILPNRRSARIEQPRVSACKSRLTLSPAHSLFFIPVNELIVGALFRGAEFGRGQAPILG